MEKFTPFDKLSKKKQRELNQRKRSTWGGLSPVTRKPPNPKAYNRSAAQRREDDPDSEPCSLQSPKTFFLQSPTADCIMFR